MREEDIIPAVKDSQSSFIAIQYCNKARALESIFLGRAKKISKTCNEAVLG